MIRGLTELTLEMQGKAVAVHDAFRDETGAELLIYCTYRSPFEQAVLYRQGRTLQQIQAKADELAGKWGRADLAKILMDAPPQSATKVVTNAGPGQSAHNYRLAWDGCPLVSGRPVWDLAHPLFQRYGEIAVRHKLDWAGLWKSFREGPHCQALGFEWRDLIRHPL